MLKIAYDYQIFIYQKYGGISRYFCELASAVTNQADFNVTVHAELYQNRYLPNYSNLLVKGLPVLDLPIPRRVLTPINHQLNQLSFLIDRPDIIHETYYTDRIHTVTTAKTVMTVFDMIHEKLMNPAEFKDFLQFKAKSIKRADKIICISESTRQDLLEIFDLDPANVITIYLAHSPLNINHINIHPIVREPYILYVGDRDAPYKNFQGLLQAYANSNRLQNYFKLVCFGAQSFSTTELNTIKDLGIDLSNIMHYSGNDSILANLYTNAAVFVYPSLYEGFGIPPLEAMSLNCPVVCSDTSSIPEVVADAGEYFDPTAIDSLINAIEKVVFSLSRSEELKQKGSERVNLFSWKKCASETSLVYRSLA